MCIKNKINAIFTPNLDDIIIIIIQTPVRKESF